MNLMNTVKEGTNRLGICMQPGSSIAVNIEQVNEKEIHVCLLAKESGRTLVAHAEARDLERAVSRAARKVYKRILKEKNKSQRISKKHHIKLMKEIMFVA